MTKETADLADMHSNNAIDPGRCRLPLPWHDVSRIIRLFTLHYIVRDGQTASHQLWVTFGTLVCCDDVYFLSRDRTQSTRVNNAVGTLYVRLSVTL